MNQCFLDRTGLTPSQTRLPTSGVVSRSPSTPSRLSVRPPPPPPRSHQGRRAESNPLAWTFINGSTNPTFIKSPQCCANPFHPPLHPARASLISFHSRSPFIPFPLCPLFLPRPSSRFYPRSLFWSFQFPRRSVRPSVNLPPIPPVALLRAPPFHPTDPRLTEPMLPREGSWVDSPSAKVSSRWRDIGRVVIKVGRIFDYFRRVQPNRESHSR